MLNQRQLDILEVLCKNSGRYYTATSLAKEYQVSVRTMQDDLKSIRREVEGEGFARFHADRGKGTYIEVTDASKMLDWLDKGRVSERDTMENRVTLMIYMLLEKFRDVSLYDLEDALHISSSSLAIDMREAKKELSRFDLRLERKHGRISIRGSETAKRRALSQNALALTHLLGDVVREADVLDLERISFLRSVLVDAFMSHKYVISDMDFNNAVLQLAVILHRVQQHFYIQDAELGREEPQERFVSISAVVMGELRARFFVRITDAEVRSFALFLMGQAVYASDEIITSEMDAFLDTAFQKIKQHYGIDFTNNIDLRIALALHCVPLVIRMRYHNQVKNQALSSIKEEFMLGFEIASYFAFLLREKYGEALIEDEIALIAAHFYGALMEIRAKKVQRRVLVLSSLKRSMTVILRSVLFTWFKDDIATLDFAQESEVDDRLLDDYDIFLTTEKNLFYERGLAMHISLFPTENDRKNIKMLIDGFKTTEDVVGIFHESLFFTEAPEDKEACLSLLSGAAAGIYDVEGLTEAVLAREAIGSTVFSKGIAMAHPLEAVSSDTFVAVAIPKSPIVWDEERNPVRLVILLHIGKNNPQSFQLWDYFAKLFKARGWFEKITANPDYRTFLAVTERYLGK
ncbi:BglG family transcription antiterminator [Selenomonas sp. TAMA-11512]|uniref:BglG family transcription antiterminator n=1 Tax=Selenomonas sp. TAMA-11512 TaxID=3095337 RepID=UPI00308A7472|nr:BglG family transcription antiterminator [Selenomonas sp. TAMA-11512]